MNQRSPEREFWFQDLGSCAQPVAVGLKSGSALVLITSDPSVAFSYFPLSFSHSLTPQRNRAADPSPLRAPPTCSQGHRWLKRWQVDSTLKLSIDPWELNQTASPPSLSARAAQWHRGKGSSEGERAVSTSASSVCTAARRWVEGGAALENRTALWCGFKQALWIHPSDPDPNDQEQLQGHYISPLQTLILGEQVYKCYYKSGIVVSKFINLAV